MRVTPTPLLLGPLAVLAQLTMSAGLADDEPAYAPASELTITKSFREDTEWVLDLLEMRMDGGAIDQPLPDCSGVGRRRVEVTDEYLGVEDGVLKGVRRTFGDLSTKGSFDADDGTNQWSMSCTCASEFDGAVVLFQWDEDLEEYRLEFEEGGSGDDDDLEGLEIDTDLVDFLPTEGVSEDDTWEVDAAAFAKVFRPSGELHFLPDENDEGTLFTIPTQFILASALTNLGDCTDEVEGEVEATYEGRDEDGAALIKLEFELTSSADRSERFQAYVADAMEDAATDGLALSFEVELDGEARLRWDLEAGRPLGFELEGEIAFACALAWADTSFMLNDEPMNLDADFEVSGDTRIEVEIGVE